MVDKKEEWEIQRDKIVARRAKGMQSMKVEQLQAVHDAYNALKSAMISIKDLNDISLSEIKALDEASFELFHEFNLKGEE